MDENRGYSPIETEGPRGQHAPEFYSLETIMNLQKLVANGIPDEPAECEQPTNHEVDMRLLSINLPQAAGSEDASSDLSTLVTIAHRTVRNTSRFLRHVVQRFFATTLWLGIKARHGKSMQKGI